MLWLAREMGGAFADLLYYTLTGRLRPLKYEGYYKELEDLPKDEIRTKTVYLDVEGVLVKIFLEAAVTHPKFQTAQASFKCHVLEIDGRKVPDEKRFEGEKRIDLFNSAPTREDEKELLLEALRHFDLEGMPRIVDNDFVEDHLQLVEVRNRLFST